MRYIQSLTHPSTHVKCESTERKTSRLQPHQQPHREALALCLREDTHGTLVPRRRKAVVARRNLHEDDHVRLQFSGSASSWNLLGHGDGSTVTWSLASHGPGSSDDNRNTRRGLDTFSSREDENARSAPALIKPTTIHCKTGSMSARLVFETRAKCQDSVARYKDDGNT